MSSPTYESHVFQDSALPFLFHLNRIAGGGTCRLNWHANVEILYCREGDGRVYCEGRTYPMTAGDIVIINENHLHITESKNGVVYDCLIVDHGFCTDNGIPTDRLFFCEHVQSDALRAAFCAVTDAYNEKEPYRTPAVRHAVLGLMLLLYRDHIGSPLPRTTAASSDRIKEAILYIRRHLDGVLSLSAVAEHLGISACYLSREFKKQTGQTLTNHINAVRCKEAKRLIEEGMSISEAALSCGFENLSYFSRTYQRMIGSRPSRDKAAAKNGLT